MKRMFTLTYKTIITINAHNVAYLDIYKWPLWNWHVPDERLPMGNIEKENVSVYKMSLVSTVIKINYSKIEMKKK